MNIIKKIFILSLILTIYTTSVTAQTKKSKDRHTVNLTRTDFLRDVMDYEKNPNKWTYKGDKPAIIDFYATWCGPCRTISPILESIAKEYKDEIYVYKIDTDKEHELAVTFGIKSLPTILFIPINGAPKSMVGLMSKEKIKEVVDDFLLQNK